MAHKCPTQVHCAGCDIPLSDGYTIACHKCDNRRQARIRRGELLSPTGYAGEAIDNTTGKLIVHA